MKKTKVISPKNLPLRVGIVSMIVNFWFLWDKLPYEWVRTVLILTYIFLISTWIYAAISSKFVDIFDKDITNSDKQV